MEVAVHMPVPEPTSVDGIATKLVDAPSFTVPLPIIVKHEVEENSFDKAKMKERFVKLAYAVEEMEIKIDRIPTKIIDSVR